MNEIRKKLLQKFKIKKIKKWISTWITNRIKKYEHHTS